MKTTSQFKWPSGVIAVSSIPIILILLGIMIELFTWATYNLFPTNGIEDTTLENALLFLGLYLAVPCGILNISVASYARSAGIVNKTISAWVVTIGILGILFGIFTWTLYFMIQSFVF